MAEEMKAEMIQNQKAAPHPQASVSTPLNTPAIPAPMYPKKSMKPAAEPAAFLVPKSMGTAPMRMTWVPKTQKSMSPNMMKFKNHASFAEKVACGG